MNIDEPILRKLLAENVAFQRLWSLHQKYELQLAELDRLHHLTPEQELSRRNLQKLKLAGKDEMAALVREASGR